MILSYQAHVLFLALFTATNLALTVPPNAALSNPAAPPDTLQAATQLDATNPRGTVCLERPAGQAVNPELYMCAKALCGLPSTADVGVFANNAPGDFQLPNFSRWKNCEVLIENRYTKSKSQSSWLEIGLAAIELNEACQEIRNRGYLGSGTTHTGQTNGIRITMRGYTGPYLGANATDPTATL